MGCDVLGWKTGLVENSMVGSWAGFFGVVASKRAARAPIQDVGDREKFSLNVHYWAKPYFHVESFKHYATNMRDATAVVMIGTRWGKSTGLN